MSEFEKGTTVRFTGSFFSYLVTKVLRGGIRHGAYDLDAIQRGGMTVQGYPRPGRVNVVFVLNGREQFRTYADRDLVAA
jgi:hypothetical protein